MNEPPSIPEKRPKKPHSFRPLLFAPPQGPDALPKTLSPPPRALRSAHLGAHSHPRSATDSHVRLRPPPLPRVAEIESLDAQELLDELCEDQLTLTVDLANLEESIGRAPRAPSARAAVRTLESRLADLSALRDVLANVHQSFVDARLQRLVVPDSPLADYLRGIYAWTHAVVRALDYLATSLAARPDWALLRFRLDEGKNFHFDELHEAIRADLLALSIVANAGSFGANGPPVEELQYAVERLLATAVALEAHLDERFG